MAIELLGFSGAVVVVKAVESMVLIPADDEDSESLLACLSKANSDFDYDGCVK